MTRKTIRTSLKKKSSKKTMRRNSKSNHNNNINFPSPIGQVSQIYAKKGSLKKVNLIFKAQALSSARKLFGYCITNV